MTAWVINSDVIELWIVFLVQLILITLVPIEPLALYRKTTKQFAEKILSEPKRPHSSSAHRMKSRIKSLTEISFFLLAWLTPIIFMIAINQFSFYPRIYHFVLLLLAINFSYFYNTTNILITALKHQQKLTSRQLLGYQLNRDTAQLSELGLTKATIEMMIYSYLRGTVYVIFSIRFLVPFLR